MKEVADTLICVGYGGTGAFLCDMTAETLGWWYPYRRGGWLGVLLQVVFILTWPFAILVTYAKRPR